MAFSTQKEFFYVPFMNENVEFECQAECVKLKSYESATDDRSWAMKDGQQSRYLSDLVTCRIPVVNIPHESSEDDDHDDQPGKSGTGKHGGKHAKDTSGRGRTGHDHDHHRGKESPGRGRTDRDKADDAGADRRRSRGRTGKDPKSDGESEVREPYPTGFRGSRGGGALGKKRAHEDDSRDGTRRPDGKKSDKDNIENAGSGKQGFKGADHPDDANNYDDSDSTGDTDTGRRGPAGRGRGADRSGSDDKKGKIGSYELAGSDRNRYDRTGPNGATAYDGNDRLGDTDTGRSGQERRGREADESRSDDKRGKSGHSGLDPNESNPNDRMGPVDDTKYDGSDRLGDSGTGRSGPEGLGRGADESGTDDKKGTTGRSGLDRNRNDRNGRNDISKYDGSGRLGDTDTGRSGPDGRARDSDPSASLDKSWATRLGDIGPDSRIGTGGARSGGHDGAYTTDGSSGNKSRGGDPSGFGSEVYPERENEQKRRERQAGTGGLENELHGSRPGDIGTARNKDQDAWNTGRGGKMGDGKNGVGLDGAGSGGNGRPGNYGTESDGVGPGGYYQGGITSNINEDENKFGSRRPRASQSGIATKNIDSYNYESAPGSDGIGRYHDVPFGGAGRSRTGELNAEKGISSREGRDVVRQGGNVSGTTEIRIDEYGNERSAVGLGGFRQFETDNKERGGAGPGKRGNADVSTDGKGYGAYDASGIASGDLKKTLATCKSAGYAACGSSRYQRDIGGPGGPCIVDVEPLRCKADRTNQGYDLTARQGSFGGSKVQKGRRPCICKSSKSIPDDIVSEGDASLIHVANRAMARLEDMLLQKNKLEQQLAVNNGRLTDITQERDELRDRLKGFKEMEQKIAELQITAIESVQAADELNINFCEQAKYAEILENELNKTEKYYEDKLKELVQREQSALVRS